MDLAWQPAKDIIENDVKLDEWFEDFKKKRYDEAIKRKQDYEKSLRERAHKKIEPNTIG